jgi:hypothetical protein
MLGRARTSYMIARSNHGTMRWVPSAYTCDGYTPHECLTEESVRHVANLLLDTQHSVENDGSVTTFHVEQAVGCAINSQPSKNNDTCGSLRAAESRVDVRGHTVTLSKVDEPVFNGAGTGGATLVLAVTALMKRCLLLDRLSRCSSTQGTDAHQSRVITASWPVVALLVRQAQTAQASIN